MNLYEGLNNKLREEGFEQEVELNGITFTVFSKDELDWFEAIKRTISGLEKYVTNFSVNTSLGSAAADVTFGTSTERSAFNVIFDKDLFGKIKSIKTTFSGLNVDEEFVRLAQELYNLYK